MAVLDEDVLHDEYHRELQNTSLRYGRMMAWVGILVLGYMFINDYFIMGVDRLAYTRLVGFIPCLLYVLLASTWLKRHRRYIIPAHVLILTAIMVSSGLFSLGLFRRGYEGSAYGAAGTMQAAVLGMFVFCNGVRKYLWAIVTIPLALTLVAILVCCTPTRVELTLFYTPFITAVCVVAAGVSQARMAAKSFYMARLVEHHKDALEEKAEALQLANNELQQFASAVAHDLKVPLHTIRAVLQRIKVGYDRSDAERTEAVEQMTFVTDTADRMSQMIASMLRYARLENCSADFCAVPLAEVLDAVTLNLKQTIGASGAEVVCGALPIVWGDRLQLITLLQELLNNAIKYARPGVAPRIAIEHEDAGAFVKLYVRDNGTGFDPAFKRTVFRPYQRLRSEIQTDGSGIGLATCAKIVKLHGGQIGVDPEEGQGCTFFFTLPRQAARG